MEFNIKDLSKEDLNRVKGILLNTCRDFEPWADMMNLSGAGDPDADGFPFDLDEIERIDITFVGREGAQESGSDVGTDADSQSASSRNTKKDAGTDVGLGLGANVNVSGVKETVGTVGGILKHTVKKVKDSLQ